MSRRSYAAHRAARVREGSIAESETDAESLASFSTYVSGSNASSYSYAARASGSYSNTGAGETRASGGLYPRYEHGPGGYIEQYATGTDTGYGRPTLRPRTFSSSSAGSSVSHTHSPRLGTSTTSVDPSSSTRPGIQYLHPHSANPPRSSSRSRTRTPSSSATRGIWEPTIPEDTPPTPPVVDKDQTLSTLHARHTRDRTRAEDRAKRREARRVRRAERERKSTLVGDRYESGLRRMLRWAGRRGWGERGMMGVGLGVVGVQRVMSALLVLRSSQAIHPVHPLYAYVDDLLHSASTAGAEDAGNRPISAMTVCLMQAIMDVALVWPLVVLLLRRQGDRTGRTNRSQVTAITTFLLSPGLVVYLSDPMRLGALYPAVILAVLALFNTGSSLLPLLLAGISGAIIGVGSIWVIAPCCIVWAACSSSSIYYPSWVTHVRRFMALFSGTLVVALSYTGTKLASASVRKQHFDLRTQLNQLCSVLLNAEEQATLERGAGFAARLLGARGAYNAQALAAVLITILGCGLPAVILANAVQRVHEHAAPTPSATSDVTNRRPATVATLSHTEKTNVTVPSVLEPINHNDRVIHAMDSEAPQTSDAPGMATLNTRTTLVAVAPLLPLEFLCTAISLSLASFVMPSWPVSEQNMKPCGGADRADSALLAPAVTLALIGAYRGQAGRDGSETSAARSSKRSRRDEDRGEEDEGWEINSLVQMVLVCVSHAYQPSARSGDSAQAGRSGGAGVKPLQIQFWCGVAAAACYTVMLGWRPLRVGTGGWYFKFTSTAIRVYLGVFAAATLLLLTIDYVVPPVPSQNLISTVRENLSLLQLGGNGKLGPMTAWVIVYPWAMRRLIMESWAVGGLV